LSVFVGAGFSTWAAGLPVARDLFDFNVDSWGPRDALRLDLLRSLKDKWDTTHRHGLAEQFVADLLGSSSRTRQAVLWYLGRRLSEPFIWTEYHAQRRRRHVLMIDENRRFDVRGMTAASRFLTMIVARAVSGIVTTNYDMVVEYALGSNGFNYGEPGEVLRGRGAYPVSTWRNPVVLLGMTPLAKIHGSISWDHEGHYTDGRRGITGNALIVAPTQEKQRPTLLEPVWRLAEAILGGATALLVFGFAFNPYDEAVLDLLARGGARLEAVLVVDLEPKTDVARELWPSAAVTTCDPPPDGLAAIERWLAAAPVRGT